MYHLDAAAPGVFLDAGTLGLDAQSILAGHLQLYFSAGAGAEPLFVYYCAFLIAFAGRQPIVMVFAAISLGMLSMALSYRLLQALFNWRVAAAAVALMTSSFWVINLGRFAYRMSSMLPLVILTLYLLWRTQRSGRYWYAVTGGMAFGLSQYTYVAARALPVLVVLLILMERQKARLHWKQIAVFAGLAFLVFLPEGIYFLQHPEVTFRRIDEVSLANVDPNIRGAGTTPLEGALNVAGMFFIQGDDNPAHNIPGRPVFDPLTGALFAGGVLLALWRSKQAPQFRWPILWLIVMSLPSVLSLESPHGVRTFGMVPAVFVLPALALDVMLSRWRVFGTILATAVLAGNTATGFDAYFVHFQPSPTTYRTLDINQTRIADFISKEAIPTMFFSDGEGTPVRFLAPASQGQGWFQEESRAIPLPARVTSDILYVAAPNAALRDEAPLLLPGLQTLPNTDGPDGNPDFFAFLWPAEAAQSFMNKQTPITVTMLPDFR